MVTKKQAQKGAVSAASETYEAERIQYNEDAAADKSPQELEQERLHRESQAKKVVSSEVPKKNTGPNMSERSRTEHSGSAPKSREVKSNGYVIHRSDSGG